MISKRSLPWIAAGAWAIVWAGAVAGVVAMRPEGGDPVGDPAGEPAGAGLVDARRAVFDHAWAWSELRATGKIPLWDSHRMGGVSLLPDATFRPFYPPEWIALASVSASGAEPWFFHAMWAFHLFLAAALMTGVARAWGFSWAVAGFAGLGWMFAGPLAAGFDAGSLARFEALCYLPLTVHGAMAAAAGARRPALLATGLGLGLAALAGTFSTFVLHLHAWFGFAIAGLLFPKMIPLSLGGGGDPLAAIGEVPAAKRNVGAAVWTAACALALGLALGAVGWIPEFEWYRISTWSGGVQRNLQWEYALRGDAFARLAVPLESMGVSYYLGAGVLCFAAASLMGRCRRASLARVSVALALVALALAAGGFAPAVHTLLYSYVPGFRWVLPVSDYVALAALGLVFAAAAGLEEFLAPSARKKIVAPAPGEAPEARIFRARGSMWMTFAAAAAVWAMVSRMSYAQIQDDPAAAERAAALLGRMRLAEGLMTVLGFAGAWAFAASMPIRLKGKREVTMAFLAAIVFFVALDGVRSAARLNAAVPALETIAALEEGKEKNKSENADNGNKSESPESEPPQADRKLFLNLEKLSDRYVLREVNGRLSGTHIAGDTDDPSWRPYSELINRLGLKHPNTIRLFGLSESKKPAPYLRQTRHKLFVETREDVLGRIAEPNFNVHESSTGLLADLPSELPPGAEPSFAHRDAGLLVSMTKWDSGEIAMETKTKLDAWVETAEPMLPGWTVRIDGRPPKYPPSPSNGLFLSFHLPAGQHAVELNYDPASFRLGLFLSLLGLGALAFIGGAKFAETPMIATQRGGRDVMGRKQHRAEVKSGERGKVWEI